MKAESCDSLSVGDSRWLLLDVIPCQPLTSSQALGTPWRQVSQNSSPSFCTAGEQQVATLGGVYTVLLPASGSPACTLGDLACSSHAFHMMFTNTLTSTPQKEPQTSLRRWKEKAGCPVSPPLCSGSRELSRCEFLETRSQKLS